MRNEVLGIGFIIVYVVMAMLFALHNSSVEHEVQGSRRINQMQLPAVNSHAYLYMYGVYVFEVDREGHLDVVSDREYMP